MDDCIFCQIASGQVPARKVFEDANVIGVLDINPANPGHVLLIPKEHVSVLPQLSDSVTDHVGKVCKHISLAMIKSLGAQGTTIFVANGALAGQRAPHVIIHIIPRIENDGLFGQYLSVEVKPEAKKAESKSEQKVPPAQSKEKIVDTSPKPNLDAITEMLNG